MGIIYKIDKRRMIPRWRSLELTTINGEIGPVLNKPIIVKSVNEVQLNEQIKVWNDNKNLSFAGDLLSSAYVQGVEQDFKSVAEYIVKTQKNESAPLLKLANKILGLSKSENKLASSEDLVSTTDKISKEIQQYKAYLNREIKNPIAWIELGRLYSILGNVTKSKKCIDIALNLDKDNRFIVRSASRFYHHFHGDKDYALQIIKNSKYVKDDPWLLSAEIAYSSILERHSKMAKVGINYLNNFDNDFLAITELAGSLGTLELMNGKFKDAKKYFKQSLIHPNDNSFAQASWIFNDVAELNMSLNRLDIPFAYEANAQIAYESGNYESSFQNALLWLKDEPYSTRPIRQASYVASIFLNKNKESINILRDGLKINPNDLELNNNLIYFLVKDDKIIEAEKIFNQSLKNKLNSSSENSNLIFTATAGLLSYRTGDQEKGEMLYQKSIQSARNAKNEYLTALATVNYVKEEIRIIKSIDKLSNLMSQLDVACKNQDDPDVKILYDQVKEDYKKVSITIHD
jgi:uncharacterized protein HemY